MPELPEVETERGRLAGRLEGRRIDRAQIDDPRLTRPDEPGWIAARLSGEVQATRRFEITPKWQVFGRITSPTVVVRDGGTLDGECAMAAEAPGTASAPPTPRQASPPQGPARS